MYKDKRKVYSVQFQGTIAAHAFNQAQFLIPLNQRETKVKSVTWEWYSRLNFNQQQITTDNNSTQELCLFIFAANLLPVASHATPMPPLAPQVNGENFRFYRPGHFQLDAFYIENDINVQYMQVNQDLLEAVDWWTSIIVELELLN